MLDHNTRYRMRLALGETMTGLTRAMQSLCSEDLIYDTDINIACIGFYEEIRSLREEVHRLKLTVDEVKQDNKKEGEEC